MKQPFFMRAPTGLIILFALFAAGCDGNNNGASMENGYFEKEILPGGVSPASPPPAVTDSLVLVHYMPWFRGPGNQSEEADSGSYGIHWGKFAHQTRNDGSGKADTRNGSSSLLHAQYPLTGPYHSSNPALLDYQVSLLLIAGIDGVIFDWYGAYPANDFGENQGYTIAMANALMKAGLQFSVMYEDNTLNMMDLKSAGDLPEALRRGKISFDWLESGWFHQPLYIKYDNRPVVFCFGPQRFMTKASWDTLFEGLANRPYFVDEDNKTNFADASFPWPPMHLRNAENIVTLDKLQTYLNSFYAAKPKRTFKVTSVFSAFDSVYGKILYNDGEVLEYTWDKAVNTEGFMPGIIQLVTWNDFGEATCFEPSIERGYKDLEFIQEKMKAKKNLPYTKEDLRWPLEFYKLRYTQTATAGQEAAIAAATNALIAGNAELYREKAAETGAVIDINDLKPLLRN